MFVLVVLVLTILFQIEVLSDFLTIFFVILSFFLLSQNDEGIVEAHWKGAAEIVLGLCTRFVNEHGEVQVLTADKVYYNFRRGYEIMEYIWLKQLIVHFCMNAV